MCLPIKRYYIIIINLNFQVLEEIGVWKNIRRISGASIGAITAGWAAVGCTSQEIEHLASVDMDKMAHGKCQLIIMI